MSAGHNRALIGILDKAGAQYVKRQQINPAKISHSDPLKLLKHPRLLRLGNFYTFYTFCTSYHPGLQDSPN